MEALSSASRGTCWKTLRSAGRRSFAPPILLSNSIQGHRVTSLRPVGKRIAFGFDNDLWFVFHLMIADVSTEPEKRRPPTAAALLQPLI